MNDVPESGTGLSTVAKAIEVMKAFARSPEWSVSGLATDLQQSKSATHRLLRTLVAGGFLAQNGARGTYHLGPEFSRLARVAERRQSMVGAARPYLARLVDETRETATLAVLRGRRGVWLDCDDGPQHLRYAVEVGESFPLHVGAGGKIILAFQRETFREAVLSAPLPRYTDTTITERERLRAELEHIRGAGHATSEGEMTPGSRAVAAPIRDTTGVVVGSLTVTGPDWRFADAELERARALVVAAAASLSRELGYDEDDDVRAQAAAR